MNNKIKILLVGLAVVCAFALVIAFQLNAVNKALRNDFAFKEQEFQTEKQNLSQQLASVTEAKKKLDAELGDLRVKFDALTKDHDGLKGKFDLVTKEHASLVDKVQDLARQKKELEDEVAKYKQSGQTSAAYPTTSGATASDDAYWANVLKEKASLEIQVKNLSSQLSDTQLKAEKAMEEGRKLDMQFKTISEARADLERKLVYNEKLSESLSSDLVRRGTASPNR